MRTSLVVLLALGGACGGNGSADAPFCPDELHEGDPCTFTGRCWNANGFSSCLAEWCTCNAHRVTCEAVAPSDGDACGDEPITSCYYEGNPDCDTAPTAEGCTCDGTTWHCYCSCWGGATCSIDPCNRPPSMLSGTTCAGPELVCDYPGGTSCACRESPGGPATFVCN